jgi:hypothetical protein
VNPAGQIRTESRFKKLCHGAALRSDRLSKKICPKAEATTSGLTQKAQAAGALVGACHHLLLIVDNFCDRAVPYKI